MEKKYTEDDLISYFYKELTPSEVLKIEEAINNNKEVKSMYLQLVENIETLNKVYLRPSEEAIENILLRAKQSLGEKTA